MTAAALAAALVFAVGSIWFGHFESGAPRWRRTLKLALVVALAAGAGRLFGTVAGVAVVGVLVAVGLTGHFVWCRRHGIDPWTAEPYERYRRLRGWA